MALRGSIMALVLLCGCTHSGATTRAVETALQASNEVQKQLPVECLTPAVQAGFAKLNQSIQATHLACDTEKAKIQSRLELWQWIAGALAVALFIVLWLK